ncbi:MAG TPA: hypothetical protein PKD55_00260 [Bellilinea sp.]|nr:hypothetical protein [Bellilinea sp.]
METYDHILETIRDLKSTVHELASGNEAFRTNIRRELRELEKQLDDQLDNMSEDFINKLAAALEEQRSSLAEINTRQGAIEKDLATIKQVVQDMVTKVEQHRKVLYGDEGPGLIESTRIAMRVATEASITAKEGLDTSKRTEQASQRMERHVSRLVEDHTQEREERDRRRKRTKNLLTKAPAISTILVTIVTFFINLWLRLVNGTDITSLAIVAAFGATLAIFLIIVLNIITNNTR